MSVLTRKVLVMNKNWIPIKTISLRKALKLLYACDSELPKAKIIDIEDFQLYKWSEWLNKKINLSDDILRLVNCSICVPKAILLSKYGKYPNLQIKFSKKAIYKRDGGICQYCSIQLTETWSIDHVIPKSRNGPTNWNNCVTCCINCNKKKSNKTPEEAGIELIKEPVKPKIDFEFKNHKDIISKILNRHE